MIKIITDSGSDILQEECDKVRVLPLHVSFGEEHYRDGVDLLHETFYEKLIETDVLPKTSQISPYEFMEAYRQELDADASGRRGTDEQTSRSLLSRFPPSYPVLTRAPVSRQRNLKVRSMS